MRLERKFFLILIMLMLTGCGSGEKVPTDEGQSQNRVESSVSGDMTLEQDILPEVAALPDILKPEASGVLVEETDRAVIDYSNTADGYVMVRFKEEITKRLKVQVKGPTTTYTYNITQNEWETFPLSDGNGDYQVALYENAEGSKYALVQSVSVSVELEDEFAPFIRPNQYVDYADATETIQIAARLTAGKEEELDKVKAVYEYVITNIAYDKELAESVQSGYLPDLDKVLEKKKGICFDYAALMTGMLRSQSVPCKLVVGYAGEAYHAWISVYTEKDGWLDNVIYFDGTTWKRMDPTFASSGSQSEETMKYIGDGTNYTEKYLY